MTTFAVTPGPLPVMVAVSPQVATVGRDGDGARTRRRRRRAPSSSRWCAPAAGPADALESPDRAPPSAETSGSVELDTRALGPGDYEVLLVGASDEVQARAPFWVQKPGARPILTTDSTAYASAEPIIVTWKNAPANRWDWIGVYKKGAADPNVDYYLIWQYTGGAGLGHERRHRRRHADHGEGAPSRASPGRSRPATTSCTTCSPTATSGWPRRSSA